MAAFQQFQHRPESFPIYTYDDYFRQAIILGIQRHDKKRAVPLVEGWSALGLIGLGLPAVQFCAVMSLWRTIDTSIYNLHYTYTVIKMHCSFVFRWPFGALNYGRLAAN